MQIVSYRTHHRSWQYNSEQDSKYGAAQKQENPEMNQGKQWTLHVNLMTVENDFALTFQPKACSLGPGISLRYHSRPSQVASSFETERSFLDENPLRTSFFNFKNYKTVILKSGLSPSRRTRKRGFAGRRRARAIAGPGAVARAPARPPRASSPGPQLETGPQPLGPGPRIGPGRQPRRPGRGDSDGGGRRCPGGGGGGAEGADGGRGKLADCA